MGTGRTDEKKGRVDARTHAIAQELEALRLKRGLSKAELARRAGVHPTQMGQILLGQQGVSLERLADLLEVLMLCQRGADRYHLKGRACSMTWSYL